MYYFTIDWVITNDWVTYGVTITNTGPGSASGVFLTNTLPSGIVLLSASGGYTTAGTNLIFSVGALAAGSSASFRFTIRPATNGVFALADTLAASSVYNSGLSNETTTEELSVTNYIGGLSVATISPQSVNYQNGLVEQTIQVSNNSGGTAPAVRVVLTGLTNELFNASATNNNLPFVVSPAALPAGGTVNLRLQFLPKGTYPWYFPITNGQLQAYAIPAIVLNYAPAPVSQTSASLNISRIVGLPNGDELLAFPTTLGRSYTIVYSDNAQFLNPMIATPAYVAPANEVQWLDYGPPATIGAPTNAAQRYYRVYLNP
jgi:uncharacterized repeat protein (TIGR01451 family)